MRTFLLSIAVALAVVSCSALDVASGDFPGMTLYEPAGAGYHLYYADPPWEEAEAGADYGAFHPSLVVPAVVVGQRAGVDRYLLQIDRVDGLDAATTTQNLLQTALADGEVVDSQPHAIHNVAGDEGQDFETHGGNLLDQLPANAQDYISDADTVRARRVVYDAPGGCYQLLVVSIYELEEPDLTQMLLSFEPRPSDAAAGDGGTQ
jgi:hypothetical protein